MERQELFHTISRAMVGDPTPALGLRSGKVKSRLIEAHPAEASIDGAAAALRNVANSLGQDPVPLADAVWSLRSSSDDVVVVDTLDPRFWLLHSTMNRTKLESFVKLNFVTRTHFDSAWMPSSVLSEFPGTRRLVASSFSGDTLRPALGPASMPTKKLRIRIEGDEPGGLIELLRSDPRFSAAAPLGSVGGIFEEPTLGHALVVADFYGRFVTSGDSFEVALGAMWQTSDRYASFVRGLEDRYRLRVESLGPAGAYTIEGDIAVLDLPEPIRDMDQLLAGLFSCREPFRLWAVPRQVDDDLWEANVVDLHVGQRLRFEIASNRITMLLPEASCGNTIARMIANLQHHLDARIDLPPSA